MIPIINCIGKKNVSHLRDVATVILPQSESIARHFAARFRFSGPLAAIAAKLGASLCEGGYSGYPTYLVHPSDAHLRR